MLNITQNIVYLWVPRALITVDSRRPSLAVTWVTYWARRLSTSSTVLDRAALPVQSHREPGRWQHSPVVISGPSRRAGGRGTPGGIREQPRSHTSSHKDPTTAERRNIYTVILRGNSQFWQNFAGKNAKLSIINSVVMYEAHSPHRSQCCESMRPTETNAKSA